MRGSACVQFSRMDATCAQNPLFYFNRPTLQMGVCRVCTSQVSEHEIR